MSALFAPDNAAEKSASALTTIIVGVVTSKETASCPSGMDGQVVAGPSSFGDVHRCVLIVLSQSYIYLQERSGKRIW